MVTLPAFFSDGMVIGLSARIWGFTAPETQLTVSFLGKQYPVMSNKDGRFDVTVTAEEYGGPYTMTVGDVIIKDIYVGRVWLCGGQSNMETPINRTRFLLKDYITDDSRIRVFQGEKGMRFDKAATDINGKWVKAENDVLDNLHAVPYFFARALLSNDPSPIGLISIPAGGTSIEGWLPEETVSLFPKLYESLKECKPPDYIQNIEKDVHEHTTEWYKQLDEKDTGLAEAWYQPNYDDEDWEEKTLLDPKGSPKYGAVWFRKKITLPETKGETTLHLGRIVNCVWVYINGKLLNSIHYMYPPCVCAIPDGFLQKGENTIAVRIVGDSFPPSFVPDKKYALESNGVCIDLNTLWKKRVGIEMPKIKPGVWFYTRPCGVYNFMLAPLLGYSVDGLIWYQGESNTGEPAIYKELFTLFAEHMRHHFDKNLPIIFTQLANFVDPGGTDGANWAALREQQRLCLSIPNTAMAVIIDCGEWNDLHPSDKKTVGDRLALCAKKLVYNEDIVSEGPVVTKAICFDNQLTVYFDNASGLWAKNGRPLLDVIDSQGFIHRLYAGIKGETLTAKINITSPERVRFGWTDNPSVTLYNAHNLPASPFEIKITGN
jgi:sialate O-acetylesterase